MKKAFYATNFEKQKAKSQKQGQTSFQKCTMEKQPLLKKQPGKAAPLVGLLAFGAKSQSQKPNQTGPNSFYEFYAKQVIDSYEPR